jgi:hypothetical protein
VVKPDRNRWPRNFRQWLVLLAPLTVIVCYILIASYKLRYPGVMYDEALYVNAALGGVDKTTFMTMTFHGFPILLMPYIGALKSYIFFPIFALFKVSPITMRFPDILLSAGALFVLYKLLREQVGKYLSFCIITLTALDASFIMFTRLDNGPVVLDFLLKIIGLCALLRFARDHQKWALYVFWLAMFLGVFNKLNFIWYVNAFVGAFILIYGRDLFRKLKKPERLHTLLVSGVGYVLTFLYYLYISHKYNLGSSLGFVGWHTIYNNLVPLISGSWFYNYALSPAKVGSNDIFWFMLIVIGMGVSCSLWLLLSHQKIKKLPVRFFGFVSLALLFILMELAITKQATAAWHYFSVYPLFGTAFVLALYFIGQTFSSLRSKLTIVRSGILVVVALLCLYQLNVYRQYAAIYGKPTSNVVWSPAIYPLASFTASIPNSQFMSLDWGTQTQLLGFNPIKNKYFEVFGPLDSTNPTTSTTVYQNYIASKPNAYYITHAVESGGFPTVEPAFFAIAEAHGKQPYLYKTIYFDRQPIFEIYRLK